MLAQYMRLQNFANEEFGKTELWAGMGKEFLKPVGLNETKEMLVSRSKDVPIRKTCTAGAVAPMRMIFERCSRFSGGLRP